MDGNLAEVMQSMSFEEEVHVNLPVDDECRVMKRSGKSLTGAPSQSEVSAQCKNFENHAESMGDLQKSEMDCINKGEFPVQL